ncbi:peptidoglycan-binding protein [uncultured Roseibium sp.]|uniref:peptidoglycan-binding protein n=1 Tax=uncultured Roseibium sp. TaxID=1936171 RepID=UPI00262172A9|nr:peptidoglycan-binding protein [uncultured Roseibium sp.]
MTHETLDLSDNPRLQSAARNEPPMCKGERGPAVAILQKAYEVAGYPMPGSIRADGSADGIFGKETYSVTRHFQIGQEISVDGIVGQNTLGALAKALDDVTPGNDPVKPMPNGPVKPQQPDPPLPGGPTVPKNPKPSPQPAKRAHFAEERIASGFDNTVFPHWQMVPTSSRPNSSGGGGAIVKLRNGEGLTVVSNNDLIKVHELPISHIDGSRQFLLTSDVDGARGQLLARNGVFTATRLQVETTRPYVLTVDFYMVSDKFRKTKRPVGELGKLVSDTSELLAQQCNVHLQKKRVYTKYHLDTDLGDVILVRDMQKRVETQDVYLIYQGCQYTADLSVFCVWDYEMNQENADNGGVHVGLSSGRGRIIVEDEHASRAKEHGKWTLMHEVGHALGLKHQDLTIMADVGQTMTSYLRMSQIHTMWEHARKTP